MKRISDKYITIRTATWDETPKGMYNQPLLLELNDDEKYFKQILNCGNMDTIAVFKDGEDYYILSYNENLEYAGLLFIGGVCNNNAFERNIDDRYFEDEETLLDYMIYIMGEDI